MVAVHWHVDSEENVANDSVEQPMCTAIAMFDCKSIRTGAILVHRAGSYLISNVLVHPDYQSEGVGKQITVNLDKRLDENGVPGAMVKLFPGIDRQAFYGQFGFPAPELNLVGVSKTLQKKP